MLPMAFLIHIKEKRLVTTQIYYSPTSKTRERKTSYHTALAASSIADGDHNGSGDNDDSPGDDQAASSSLEEVQG